MNDQATTTPKPEKVLNTRVLSRRIAELEAYRGIRDATRYLLEETAVRLARQTVKAVAHEHEEDEQQQVDQAELIARNALRALFESHEQRHYLDLTKAVAAELDGATRIE